MQLRSLSFILLLASAVPCCAQKPATTMTIGGRVFIGPIRDSSASISEVLAQPLLTVSNKDCKVISYDVVLTKAGSREAWGPVVVHGNAFSNDILNRLRQMSAAGGKIYIDDVKLNCGDKEAVATPVQLLILPDQ